MTMGEGEVILADRDKRHDEWLQGVIARAHHNLSDKWDDKWEGGVTNQSRTNHNSSDKWDETVTQQILKHWKRLNYFYFEIVYCNANKSVCSIQHFIPRIPTVSEMRDQRYFKKHWG